MRMSFPPNEGPIAAYRNLPIEAQFYQPSRFQISAISLGNTTTITTTADTNYVMGQLVRVLIPPTYGTRQLNEQQGYVIGIPSTNQVTLDINTSIGYNAFVPSPSYGPTKPQIIAIGDTNSGQINASGRINQTTYVQGSFINISPL